MRLRHSPSSPFVRKVRAAAAFLGIELELEPADTMNEQDALSAQNPISKIPILLRDNGAPLFDSPVIVAYLDHVAGGGRLIPSEPEAKFDAMRLEALADGIMEAALLQVYEVRYRDPEHREPRWVAMQAAKVRRALDFLEHNLPPVRTPTSGDIALGCALGYLDFRLDGAWRADHPNLVAWFAAFPARCPGFAETAPQ